MEKEIAIERISEALYNNNCAIFVGSGISYPSTNIDWFKLLEPLANELGIKLDSKHDELPLIAQYIVNQYAGNRGPLINQISKAFNKKFNLNAYHKVLTLTKLSTIWTTNYDTLLELAFSEFLTDIKVNNDLISRNVNNADIEIIKMHGCISKSGHKEIVITQEDYEDFELKNPAIVERLRTDLMKRSLLFIGYSYRDPNIRNIMISARRLCNNSTQEHYLILRREVGENNQSDKEIRKRQELWVNDLKRVGISTIFIDKHSELEDMLYSISQRSRGKTVYVTGSHKGNDYSHYAQELGAKLAKEENIILISGQSAGIGANTVSSFMEQCILEQQDINSRIKIFPNPYAANPKFSDDLSLLPILKKFRASLFNSTQVVIIFNGGEGTEVEFEVAINRNCKVIPVIFRADDRNSEVMRKILGNDKVMSLLKDTDFEYYSKLNDKQGQVTVEDIHRCLMKIMK